MALLVHIPALSFRRTPYPIGSLCHCGSRARPGSLAREEAVQRIALLRVYGWGVYRPQRRHYTLREEQRQATPQSRPSAGRDAPTAPGRKRGRKVAAYRRLSTHLSWDGEIPDARREGTGVAASAPEVAHTRNHRRLDDATRRDAHESGVSAPSPVLPPAAFARDR